jgi:hypothetical protein
MRPEAIHFAVDQRIAQYERENRSEALEFRKWEKEYFGPLVDRLESENGLKILCWEDTISAIRNANARRTATN